MATLSQWITAHAEPEKIRGVFLLTQVLFAAALLGFGAMAFLSRSQRSGFRISEAERLDLLRRAREAARAGGVIALEGPKGPSGRAPANGDRPGGAPEPLRLTGIRIDGAPHEILGVAARSTPAQVQKAYRDLMKRYHPDKIGRPGTREWRDAQRIAEALNQAKDALLNPSRRAG
jgi:DnaJ-domain-containing protein 1